VFVGTHAVREWRAFSLEWLKTAWEAEFKGI